jgi:hypothetical protein
MLVYDCEIEKAILGKNETPVENVQYCQGWRDFKNMGISVIGAYDFNEHRYRIFCRDNLDQFQDLVNKHNIIAGFNSIAFDNQLCEANGIHIPKEKSYDLLVAIWKAAGLGPVFEYPSHMGFSLDAVCSANLAHSKSGNGAAAPRLWQLGKIGSVIDYCLNDVRLTYEILVLIQVNGWIFDPRNPSQKLYLEPPDLPF